MLTIICDLAVVIDNANVSLMKFELAKSILI